MKDSVTWPAYSLEPWKQQGGDFYQSEPVTRFQDRTLFFLVFILIVIVIITVIVST